MGSFVLRSSHTRVFRTLGLALALPACVDLDQPAVTEAADGAATDGGAGDLLNPAIDAGGLLDGMDAAPLVAPIRSGLRGDFFAGLDFLNYTGTYFDSVVDLDQQAITRVGGARTGRPTQFSARWTGEVRADVDGAHVFVLTANDGVRLWVGGTLVIDDWATGSREREGMFTMTAGQQYPITLEYFQEGSVGNCSLKWRGPGFAVKVIPSGNLRHATLRAGMPGLRAEFFADAILGTPSGIFHDTRISLSPPEAVIVAQARTGTDINYSARWTGEVLADFSEQYTFEIDADDSARVWLEGIQIVAPPGSGSKISRGTTTLKAGQWYALRVEFSQSFGPSSMFLRWSSPSVIHTLVPTDHLRYPNRED